MSDELSYRRRLLKLEERLAALEGERLNVVTVERLTIQPDDVLFVHVADDTEPAQMDEVARIIAEHLGTRRVLILAGETTVSVGTLPPDEATRVLGPVDSTCPLCGGAGCDDCGGSGVRNA
jgi:hypothetical protein